MFRSRVLLCGSSVLLSLAAGCSDIAPADTQATLTSVRRLVDADVRIVAPVLRGDNELFVALRPQDGQAESRLVDVSASMPAHAHTAVAQRIVRDGETFHVSGLKLFMTGRWLVTLSVTVDGRDDSLSLPVDVP